MPKKEEWAQAYISRYTNFGQHTTSPTEGAHCSLKSYGVTSKSTLEQVV